MESNELPIEDLNLIAHIDARLKRMQQLFMSDLIGTPTDIAKPISTEGLVYGFDTNPIGVDVNQSITPIEQVEEVRYVRCVISVLVFTEGHIYKLSSVSANNIEPFVMYNGIQHCSYEQYRMFFFPATEAEYLSQQEQPKSIVKEEVKERYEVGVLQRVNSNQWCVTVNLEHTGRNEAELLKDKIKALLQTL